MGNLSEGEGKAHLARKRDPLDAMITPFVFAIMIAALWGGVRLAIQQEDV